MLAWATSACVRPRRAGGGLFRRCQGFLDLHSRGKGGNQYEDLSQDVPPTDEWARAQDPTHEELPVRHRIRTNRATDDMEDEEAQLWATGSATTPTGRAGVPEPDAGECWWFEPN